VPETAEEEEGMMGAAMAQSRRETRGRGRVEPSGPGGSSRMARDVGGQGRDKGDDVKGKGKATDVKGKGKAPMSERAVRAELLSKKRAGVTEEEGVRPVKKKLFQAGRPVVVEGEAEAEGGVAPVGVGGRRVVMESESESEDESESKSESESESVIITGEVEGREEELLSPGMPLLSSSESD
jgi:hypothetical protein